MENELTSLLEGVRSGDHSAFAALLEMYSPAVDGAVRRFSLSFDIGEDSADAAYSREDLYQIASLALYRAAETYDPHSDKKGKQVSFGLYAKICVNNALVSLLRKYNSEKKRRTQKKSDKIEAIGRTRGLSPEELYVGENDANELRRRIKASLTDYENKVYTCYISGKSIREIALILDREEKSISNALYRIKVKVRGLLQNQ